MFRTTLSRSFQILVILLFLLLLFCDTMPPSILVVKCVFKHSKIAQNAVRILVWWEGCLTDRHAVGPKCFTGRSRMESCTCRCRGGPPPPPQGWPPTRLPPTGLIPLAGWPPLPDDNVMDGGALGLYADEAYLFFSDLILVGYHWLSQNHFAICNGSAVFNLLFTFWFNL